MQTPSAIDTLTEKEKQALRLLVTGYDAKSMARYLGLSVHTVNERLRDARRKLGLGSSREAARMLREAETARPEFSGDGFFRDAPVHLVKAGSGAPAGQSRSRWVIGGLTMSLALSIAAAALLLKPGDAPGAAASPPATASAAAELRSAPVRAALDWLALVDAQDWQGSWRGTTQSFQSLNSAERWASVAASVQGPLGAVIEHRLASSEFVPTPPAGYQMVKFRSDYANRKDVLLTITLEQDGAAWKVAGIMLD
jgi:DNA-binding CsgD family transcriptional regulator